MTSGDGSNQSLRRDRVGEFDDLVEEVADDVADGAIADRAEDPFKPRRPRQRQVR